MTTLWFNNNQVRLRFFTCSLIAGLFFPLSGTEYVSLDDMAGLGSAILPGRHHQVLPQTGKCHFSACSQDPGTRARGKTMPLLLAHGTLGERWRDLADTD